MQVNRFAALKSGTKLFALGLYNSTGKKAQKGFQRRKPLVGYGATPHAG